MAISSHIDAGKNSISSDKFRLDSETGEFMRGEPPDSLMIPLRYTEALRAAAEPLGDCFAAQIPARLLSEPENQT